MTLNPVLRKLNDALAKHGIRICESCGDCHALVAPWFRPSSGGYFLHICIPCDSRQRRQLWDIAEHYAPHPQSRLRQRRAFERILAGIERKAL